MKPFLPAIATLAIAQAFGLGATAHAAAALAVSKDPVHRYVVESNSPPSTQGKAKANDASVGVHWLRSYSTADKARTYSLYEAPSEEAIRKAAALNRLSVTHVDEAPVDLDSESDARSGSVPAGMHRYMIERTFPAGALDGLDSAAKAKVNATNSKFGAQWVTSYANSGKTKTYCVYNAADEAAVRAAAKANGIPVDKVTEVPLAAAAK
ncbi:MAG: nickel-binding protein [Steroidobacteraceae bacterium]